jgi:uncharacterized protein YdhG (YjbR/CyaY superfamily)
MSGRPVFSTIDEYIASFPPELQKILQELRAVIRAAAPACSERISYAMPTFFWHRNLVHFAAYDRHIGFYPGPEAIEKFQQEFSVFKSSKGAVQFPLDQPLPFDLIARVVQYRVQVEQERAASMVSKKK